MKKIIILLLLFFCFFETSFWYTKEILLQIDTKYDSFINKVEYKYALEKRIYILSILWNKINSLLEQTGISSEKKDILRYLYSINQDKLQTYKNENTPLSFYTSTKNKELKYIITLKTVLQNAEIPNYIESLKNGWKTLYIVDKNYEFVEGSGIKKIVFTKYYNIDSYNYKAFNNLEWDIVYNIDEDKFLFISNIRIEDKILYSYLYNKELFPNNFIDSNNRYVLENWVYYTYNYTEYRIFSDAIGYYNYALTDLWFNTKNIIFLKDKNWKFWFIPEVNKVKLINENILAKINNKDYFLKQIIDDKRFLSDDTDEYFKDLFAITEKLIVWVEGDEKKTIKIYEWILENITYTKNIDLSDTKIFSWILTFKNRDWVCDGYTKLMGYMLLYAGVENIEVIKWFVIDVPDFPQIWHAWVKIGDYYYDPTFDDPVWNTEALHADKYKYYKLPKDIFYTNRFNIEDLPEYLKTTPYTERASIVQRNLATILNKYQDSTYNLFDLIKLKVKYKIPVENKISIENLKKMIPFYEINTDFQYTQNWETKYIQKLSYYPIARDSEVEIVLSQLGYDVTNTKLFKWKIWDNNYEYRLWYNIVIAN